MFKNPMFCIFTENRFNQVLIFPTWEAAANWARSATTWSEDEIAMRIRVTHWNGSDYLSVSE